MHTTCQKQKNAFGFGFANHSNGRLRNETWGIGRFSYEEYECAIRTHDKKNGYNWQVIKFGFHQLQNSTTCQNNDFYTTALPNRLTHKKVFKNKQIMGTYLLLIPAQLDKDFF